MAENDSVIAAAKAWKGEPMAIATVVDVAPAHRRSKREIRDQQDRHDDANHCEVYPVGERDHKDRDGTTQEIVDADGWEVAAPLAEGNVASVRPHRSCDERRVDCKKEYCESKNRD